MYRPLTNGSSARRSRIAPALASPMLLVFGAAAGASPVSIEPVDNSSALTGFVTQDIVIDRDFDWRTAAIRVDLTQGSIYQHPLNNTVLAPNPGLVALDPAAAFDTSIRSKNNGPMTIAGGAGDLGKTGFQFDSSGLGATWTNFIRDDVGAFTSVRVTLTDDAVGSWAYLYNELTPGILTRFEGRIVDGRMVPATDVDFKVVRLALPTPFDHDGTLLTSEAVLALSDADVMSLRVTTFAGEVVAASSLGLTPGELRFALGSAGVIPEPATLALLAAGLAAATRHRPARRP